uniref:Ig-like domain-containing protein n=1 Tax=Strigamia maritima TaxID=126957 RepID=T1IXG9_STRMM
MYTNYSLLIKESFSITTLLDHFNKKGFIQLFLFNMMKTFILMLLLSCVLEMTRTERIIVKKGDPVTLVCPQYSSSTSRCVLVKKDDGTIVADRFFDGEVFTIVNSTTCIFVATNLTFSDSGEYKCTTDNTITEFILSVFVKPAELELRGNGHLARNNTKTIIAPQYGQVQFVCTSSQGYPKSNFSWFVDDQLRLDATEDIAFVDDLINSKSTLAVSYNSKDREKVVKCVINHEAYDVGESRILVGIFGPKYDTEVVKIRKNFIDNNLLIPGEFIEIICEADGLPEAKYFQLKKQNTIGEWVLISSKAKTNITEPGVYICEDFLPEKHVTVKQGDSVTFDCINNVTKRCLLMKNKTIVADRSEGNKFQAKNLSGCTFETTNLNSNDSGHYICYPDNNYRPTSFILNVIADIITPMRTEHVNVNVTHGDSVTLECSKYVTNNCKLMKNERFIANRRFKGQRFHAINSTACIFQGTNLNISDNGQYTCFTDNITTEFNISVTVEVIPVTVKPDDPELWHDGEMVENNGSRNVTKSHMNGSVEFECRSNQGYPKSNISWFVDNKIRFDAREEVVSDGGLLNVKSKLKVNFDETHESESVSRLKRSLNSSKKEVKCAVMHPAYNFTTPNY